MIVLAADIATTSGLAWDAPGGGRPMAVTFRAPAAVDNDFGRAYAKFRQFLLDRIETVRPDLFVFEAPLPPKPKEGKGGYFSTYNTARMLMGLAAVAEECATTVRQECDWARHLQISEENVGTIKRIFGGHGHCDKAAIKARCRQLGWDYRNDNEADAMGLWYVAKSKADPAFRVEVGTPLFGRGSAA